MLMLNVDCLSDVFPMQEFAQYHLNKSSNHELGTTDELLKGGTSKLLFEPMFFYFYF